MNSVRATSRRPRRVSRPRPVQPERNNQERGNAFNVVAKLIGPISNLYRHVNYVTQVERLRVVRLIFKIRVENISLLVETVGNIEASCSVRNP